MNTEVESGRGGDAVEDMTAAVCLFRSLADPARLAILRHLARGEHRVVELTAHVGLAQSTVSQHLSCLRDCGLVSARAQGRASYYSLARPEILDLLACAEALLETTGHQVTLCPTYGIDTADADGTSVDEFGTGETFTVAGGGTCGPVVGWVGRG